METQQSNRRRLARHAAMLLCDVRQGNRSSEVARIRDFNELGLKIATRRPLKPGDALLVRVPGAPDWTPAHIAWAKGQLAGIALLRALDLPALAVATRRGKWLRATPSAW